MKRISLLVIGAHVVVLCWMALWMPAKQPIKKPIVVRSVALAPPPPPPKPVAAAPPKPAPPKRPIPVKAPAKKVTQAPQPQPKKPAVSSALLQELQSSIEKIENKNSTAISPLKLQIDSQSDTKESIYAVNLIQCLQGALMLPGVGAVKVELTLRNDGNFVKMRVIESKSNQNKVFLEGHLPRLSYPKFTGELKQEKEHAFVITFCNH